MNQSLPEQKYCFVLRKICSHVCFGWKELLVCWVYDLKFMLEKIVQIFDPCHFQLCQFWPWKGLKRLVGHRRFQIGTVEGALQGCQLNKWKRIECRANLSIREQQQLFGCAEHSGPRIFAQQQLVLCAFCTNHTNFAQTTQFCTNHTIFNFAQITQFSTCKNLSNIRIVNCPPLPPHPTFKVFLKEMYVTWIYVD